jgi:hypothetical protein
MVRYLIVNLTNGVALTFVLGMLIEASPAISAGRDTVVQRD